MLCYVICYARVAAGGTASREYGPDPTGRACCQKKKGTLSGNLTLKTSNELRFWARSAFLKLKFFPRGCNERRVNLAL